MLPCPRASHLACSPLTPLQPHRTLTGSGRAKAPRGGVGQILGDKPEEGQHCPRGSSPNPRAVLGYRSSLGFTRGPGRTT